MKAPLELLIGLRYTRSRRRDSYVSFISLISMLGMVIGVWALITVLSVMNGFEKELRERILTVASHVTISAKDGQLSDWPRIIDRLKVLPEVTAAAPYINAQAMLVKGGSTAGALLRGVLVSKEKDVSNIFQHLISGTVEQFEEQKWQIILGSELAWNLDAKVGDRVTVIAPQGTISVAGILPRLKRFTVSAIFELGMYEYDSTLALIQIDEAAQLFRTEGMVNGLRLALDDVYRAPINRLQIEKQLGSDFLVSDWTLVHRNFFRALQIEKRVMFLILLLIIAVAAFNIISTLVMVVVDKESDVAILRTLGFSARSVMVVFVIQGTLIGAIGTGIGGIVGIITALNVASIVSFFERMFQMEFFPASVYVISDFPADMQWQDVVLILCCSFLLGFIATLYPAWRAAKTLPAEVLRHG